MPDRIIKESICTSDTLNKLSDFEERFWHRLIVNCDDYGRFDARPAILKGRLFPLMDGKTLKDMSDTLSKLASVGLVELYEVDGKPFLHVVTWDKYQRIRAKRSKFPEPNGTRCHLTADVVKCPRNPIQSESESNPNPNTTRTAAVVSAYLDRINPSASQSSIEELTAFADEMGQEVCLRAMDIALDNKKATWSYIRGILRNWQALGVKCLADIERLDKKPETGNQGKKLYATDYSTPEAQNRLRNDMAELEALMRGEKT